jgi:energy-converting hydrogenase Eha subunit F
MGCNHSWFLGRLQLDKQTGDRPEQAFPFPLPQAVTAQHDRLAPDTGYPLMNYAEPDVAGFTSFETTVAVDQAAAFFAAPTTHRLLGAARARVKSVSDILQVLDRSCGGERHDVPLNQLQDRIAVQIDFDPDVGRLPKLLGIIFRKIGERVFHSGLVFLHQGFTKMTLSSHLAVK